LQNRVGTEVDPLSLTVILTPETWHLNNVFEYDNNEAAEDEILSPQFTINGLEII
jgi:hypothetical protein